MKISLALGPRQPLSPESAWGCFTTNLAVPGFGSLMAGRPSGYPQVVLGLLGFALTSFFGLRFFAWFLSDYSRIRGDQSDPFGLLVELWQAARWPLLGVSVFLAGWLWALVTSLQVLRESKRAQPPKLSS